MLEHRGQKSTSDVILQVLFTLFFETRSLIVLDAPGIGLG